MVNGVYSSFAYERPVAGPPPPEYHGPVVQIRVTVPGIQVLAPPAPVLVIQESDDDVGRKPKKFKNKKFKGKKFKTRD